jgi:hypothetical protein
MRFGSCSKLYSRHICLLTSIIPTAWRVQPRNYLLFACHFTNATAQSIQETRFINYWYRGGREKKLTEHAHEGQTEGKVTQAILAHEESKKAS